MKLCVTCVRPWSIASAGQHMGLDFLTPAPGIILHKQMIPLDNGSYLKDSFRGRAT